MKPVVVRNIERAAPDVVAALGSYGVAAVHEELAHDVVLDHGQQRLRRDAR